MSIQQQQPQPENLGIPAKPAGSSQFTSHEEEARLMVRAAFDYMPSPQPEIITRSDKAALAETPARINAEGEVEDAARYRRIKDARNARDAAYLNTPAPELSIEDLLQEQ